MTKAAYKKCVILCLFQQSISTSVLLAPVFGSVECFGLFCIFFLLNFNVSLCLRQLEPEVSCVLVVRPVVRPLSVSSYLFLVTRYFFALLT